MPGIDELLEQERSHLDRLTPAQAASAAAEGALLVDIRYAELREPPRPMPCGDAALLYLYGLR